MHKTRIIEEAGEVELKFFGMQSKTMWAISEP
jgi:hypothetical protein